MPDKPVPVNGEPDVVEENDDVVLAPDCSTRKPVSEHFHELIGQTGQRPTGGLNLPFSRTIVAVPPMARVPSPLTAPLIVRSLGTERPPPAMFNPFVTVARPLCATVNREVLPDACSCNKFAVATATVAVLVKLDAEISTSAAAVFPLAAEIATVDPVTCHPKHEQ